MIVQFNRTKSLPRRTTGAFHWHPVKRSLAADCSCVRKRLAAVMLILGRLCWAGNHARWRSRTVRVMPAAIIHVLRHLGSQWRISEQRVPKRDSAINERDSVRVRYSFRTRVADQLAGKPRRNGSIGGKKNRVFVMRRLNSTKARTVVSARLLHRRDS